MESCEFERLPSYIQCLSPLRHSRLPVNTYSLFQCRLAIADLSVISRSEFLSQYLAIYVLARQITLAWYFESAEDRG